ncbi:MAG: hypothetical protein ACRC62_05395 [Microcoleus sp.]
MSNIFDEVPTPDAAAMISFNRVSGGNTALFGSPFLHQGYIMMRVKGCQVKRSHGRTWYFGRHEYLEVAMSYSQFAEAITAMNIGDGVPCTMIRMEGAGDFPPIELHDERSLFDKEISDDAQKATDAIKDAIAALSEVKMSAKDREILRGKLAIAQKALTNSIPFVAEQYAEYMDGMEQKAKTEIVSYLDMTAHQYGVDAMKALALPEAKND